MRASGQEPKGLLRSTAEMGTKAIARLICAALLLVGSGCLSSTGDAATPVEHDARIYGALDPNEVLQATDLETRRTHRIRAVLRARQAEKQGDPDEAFRQYQRAYALAVDDADVRRDAAELVRLSGALRWIPELPAAARAIFEQAEEHGRAQEWAEAEAGFRKVVRAAPWRPESYFNLALVLARLEHYEEASENMERYLRLAPESERDEVAHDKLFRWKAHLPAPAPAATP